MAAQLTKLAKIKRLSPAVISILGCNPSPMTLLGTNTYLVGTGAQRILIDTGEGGVPEYLNSLHQVLKDTNSTVSAVIITHHHVDHIGGLTEVRGLLKSNVPAYKMDFPKYSKECLQAPVNELHHINDHHVFSVEGATLTALYNPGHCDDNMVLWLKEEQALFSSDTVLGEGTAEFKDLSAYMKSLNDIRERNPSRLYPGHGPMVKDPIPHVEYYIKHRQDREDQIVGLFSQDEAQSATSIVKILYKDYPIHIHAIAAKVVLIHLRKLLIDGKLTCNGDNHDPSSIWSRTS